MFINGVMLPKEFLKEKITYTPSKTDIKKALQAGEFEVPRSKTCSWKY